MRRLTVVLGLVGCGSPSAPEPQTFEFGPYTLTPGQEISGQCVSVTLHNEEPLYINAVELTTGPGFHHSNWFWVPDTQFDGPDGTWRCSERAFDDAVAGITGGVLFAQSTQTLHEKQQFPAGTAIVVPPHSRILSGTHLLNSGDEPVDVSLSLTVTPIAEPTTLLAGMSFTIDSLAIPPHRQSRFTVDCDLDSPHRNVLGRPVDFSFVYALAHYHDWGTGMTLEALGDGGNAMVYETTTRIGDALGGMIDPAFSMAGYSRLKFSCNYDNQGDTTIRWGLSSGEMCMFLAFTDSEKTWGGGVLTRNEVPTSTIDHGAYIEYTYGCSVINAEPNR